MEAMRHPDTDFALSELKAIALLYFVRLLGGLPISGGSVKGVTKLK